MRKTITLDGKPTTYADIARALDISRQAAKAKYDRAAQIHGVVTTAILNGRLQDPVVAARKQARMLSVADQRVVTHARLHGMIHTSMVFDMTHAEIQALLDAAN